MNECDNDCKNCAEKDTCDARKTMLEDLNELSSVKRVIGIVSGKGGVGKSMVCSLLAAGMAKRGFRTAVLDADVLGPSIPKMFGVKGPVDSDGKNIYPVMSRGGTAIISSNFFLSRETDPVIWRGPIIAGMVKQFWTDVVWNDVDFMFVDMPPGTGDVPLTVFQSIRTDGIVIVTNPQELVSMIVGKAVNMAEKMRIPILGVVENMSYAVCPKCGEKFDLFGSGKVDEVATDYGLKVLGRLPVDPAYAIACDKGEIESAEAGGLFPAIEALRRMAEADNG